MNDTIKEDHYHRELALDKNKSFIIQAPAGSGKTELLIQRFLTLLPYVNTPEEILAITFTKKAANEMRHRLVQALKLAKNEPEPEKPHARKTWHMAKKVLAKDESCQWNLLNNPNQLRIQTIDSLCTYLTKQLPLLSHFGSTPNIATDPLFLYQEAVEEVLMHVEADYPWSQAIAKLLLHLDNDLNKLQQLLINLLAKRDQWLTYIHLEMDNEAIKKELESYLCAAINDTLKNIVNLMPDTVKPEILALCRYAASNMHLNQQEHELLSCLDIETLPPPNSTHLIIFIGIAKLLLTKSFSYRKRIDAEIGFPPLTSFSNKEEKNYHKVYRDRFTSLIKLLSDREDLRAALEELFHLPMPTYDDHQWQILKALLQVLKIVVAQLKIVFKQHGFIDFIENARAALMALGSEDNPTDLALLLDYQFKHILVDEFQDTAITQYLLLEKLTMGWEMQDGRTLFIVGDPMQSIYRFREAEVGLFIRMWKNGIGQIRLHPLVLSVNFRSHGDIVTWNNQIYKQIFPQFNDIATGAVTYKSSVANPYFTYQEAARIEVKGFIDCDIDKKVVHIVSTIQELKKCNPSDSIAILVRARSHLNEIIPALKKAHIPYQALDIDPLVSRQSIQDLFALTSALHHPCDRIAWLSILRAPWCGLPLKDLWQLSKEKALTLWEQMNNPQCFATLSNDGQKRILRILPILKDKILNRSRYDLRTYIENTWILLGGPATLHDHVSLNDVEVYFNLLSEYQKSNQPLNIVTLKHKINQLYATTEASSDAIQIMTIHTAKGLEFDHVLLPHLERKMPYDDKTLLAWLERPLIETDKNALLLAPIHKAGSEDKLYNYICRSQKLKSSYECDRLLYVATTRAKKSLYLFFQSKQNNKGDIKNEKDSFLEKLWPHFKKQQEDICYLGENESTSTEQGLERKPKYLFRLSHSWQNPYSITVKEEVASYEKDNQFVLKDHTKQYIGIIIHRILQFIYLYMIKQMGALFIYKFLALIFVNVLSNNAQ